MTAPGEVKLARHAADINDDGHHVTPGPSSALGGHDVTPPLSLALPPWVGPSGTGVITADAIGRINVMTGTGYKSFPGMTFLEGRLHLVYRYGTAHNSSGAEIDYKWSDDLGATWFPTGTATTLVLAVGSNDVRDPSIVALSSGRLLVTYDTREPYNSTNIRTRVIYSDDRGQSWSSSYLIPSVLTGTEAAGTSQPIELPNGTVLIPGYIENGGFFISVLWKSTDGGATFPTQITVASSGSREYAEPQIRYLASGNLVCLMRSDTNQHTWRTVSTDLGATWSTPADVLTASSRPDFVEFYPGALLGFFRNNNTNFYARWAVSWDEGATWTSLQNLDGSTDLLMYAAPVVLAPGYVAVVYSIENSSSDADLYLRYFYDGATGISADGTPHGFSAGAGTVTSVAMTVPAEFSVAGSPVTTSGTLAITKANESANTVWAGPTTGSAAAPTFRALVAADIPAGISSPTDHEHIGNIRFSGDGSTTVFELPAAPYDAYSVVVWVGTTLTDVTLSGTLLTTMTFGSAPTSGTDNIRVDLVTAAA